MKVLVLAVLLAQAPDAGRPGENDVPVLVDIQGRQIPVDGALPLGSVCLTYDKAASVRDDLAEKTKRAAQLEDSLRKTDPAFVKVVIFTVAGLLTGAAVAAGAICGTGHCR